MRRWLCLCLFTLPLGLVSAPAARSDDDAGPFLNGKDLTGWEGLISDHWKWDGDQKALIGSTKPDGIKFNTFLCSKRKYGDFEMVFQVKMNKEGDRKSVV